MIEVSVQRRQGAFRVDAAFTAQEVGVTALFGPSGAGKSSVISMVAGLVRPDDGRIVIGDRVLFDSEAGVDLAPERRRVGYVFQDGRLFPHMTVHANLTYGFKRVAPAQRVVDLPTVVDLLGIGHLLDRRPARLSGGEKQRVAIGRALLCSPRLLLMDEPLASLDVNRKDEVLPFVARLPREVQIPILYVTHSLDEILRLADRIVVMDHGRVAATGPAEDILNRPDLRTLLGRQEPGAVLPAEVLEHDDGYGLTRLACPGGIISVPRMDIPGGAKVRVRILARDVTLAIDPPSRISSRNVFRGRVTSIAAAEPPYVDVTLDIGAPLLARVTRLAAVEMGLTQGMQVHALVKAVSIARTSVGERATAGPVPLFK